MKLLISLLVILLCRVSLQAENIAEAIRYYNGGKYAEAAAVLENTKEKDAKVHYFLGLAYYRSGSTEAAKRNFLKSYLLSPGSRWGLASYENYSSLRGKKLNLAFSAGLNYDSNASYLPEPAPSGSGAGYLSLNFSSWINPGRSSTLRYSYSRDQYAADMESLDSHTIRLSLFRGEYELYAGPTVSTLDLAPYSAILSAGLYGGFFSISGSAGRYAGDYNYLDGYRLNASVFREVSDLLVSYIYTLNRAADRNTGFVYQKAAGTVEQDSLDFEQADSGSESFTSYSYSMHSLDISKDFGLGDSSIRVFGTAAFKIYSGENTWYRSTWLNDTAAGKWYYWDYGSDNWVESIEPPGEKFARQRRDILAGAGMKFSRKISGNTTFTVSLEYRKNLSSIDDGENSYSWAKAAAGAGVEYRF